MRILRQFCRKDVGPVSPETEQGAEHQADPVAAEVVGELALKAQGVAGEREAAHRNAQPDDVEEHEERELVCSPGPSSVTERPIAVSQPGKDRRKRRCRDLGSQRDVVHRTDRPGPRHPKDEEVVERGVQAEPQQTDDSELGQLAGEQFIPMHQPLAYRGEGTVHRRSIRGRASRLAAVDHDADPSPVLRRSEGGFPVVGIIGGGQLARMCQPPAVALNLTLSVLAESDTAAAALVVPHSPVGACDDLDAVLDFARNCDVVTFDHEQVPQPVLQALVEAGVRLHPDPAALVYAQDKIAMRRRLSEMGIPCPRWSIARTQADVETFGAQVGWPVVAKTPRGGYDGKGVRVIEAAADLSDWLDRVGEDEPSPLADGILLEEAVQFSREIAVLVARSPSGQAASWPVVETVQQGGICTEVLAPAPELPEEVARAATQAALRIAGELNVTGVMAVEMFDMSRGAGVEEHEAGFMVNELAMRPHNSGHWSIDGSVTSQFEQHLRAVLDLPLGETHAREPWTAMANVLGGDHPELYSTYRHLMARDPGLRVHLYGKSVRPGRKIGHVTVYGEDLDQLRARGRHAADFMQGVIDE